MKGKLVKRVVSVALAAAMVFSMTACGGGSDSGSADSGEKQSSMSSTGRRA